MSTQSTVVTDAATIADLKQTLNWVSENYKSTLAGKPVKDADECLLHSDLLLKRIAEKPSEG